MNSVRAVSIVASLHDSPFAMKNEQIRYIFLIRGPYFFRFYCTAITHSTCFKFSMKNEKKILRKNNTIVHKTSYSVYWTFTLMYIPQKKTVQPTVYSKPSYER